MSDKKITPCPYCHEAWLYVGDGSYCSPLEAIGHRVSCKCGYAWKHSRWHLTEEKAIETWNKFVEESEVQS